MRLSWDADTLASLSLGIIKAHLRITHAQFDGLIMTQHLPAAISWAEGDMRRSILSKSHVLVLDSFPTTVDQSIVLPRGKCSAVASIVYDTGGATTTLRGPTSGSPIGTGFREDLRSDNGGVLFPTYNGSWPSVDSIAPAPVVITYTAGWTAATIPNDIRLAMLMYISDALEVTGAADLMPSTDLAAKDSLLSPWRLLGW